MKSEAISSKSEEYNNELKTITFKEPGMRSAPDEGGSAPHLNAKHEKKNNKNQITRTKVNPKPENKPNETTKKKKTARFNKPVAMQEEVFTAR